MGGHQVLSKEISHKTILRTLELEQIERLSHGRNLALTEHLIQIFFVHLQDDVYESFVQKGYYEGPRHHQPRRYRDLLMWLFWAVILCVPLFSYMGKVFLSGTLTQQLTLLAVVAVGEYQKLGDM